MFRSMKSKRIISFLLTLAMLFSMLPGFSLDKKAVADDAICTVGRTGYNDLSTAIEAAAGSNGTVTLLADVTLTLSKEEEKTKTAALEIPSKKSVTLDLAGHVLTSSNAAKAVIATDNGAGLTITDSGAKIEHYFTYHTNAAWEYIAKPGDGIKADALAGITDKTTTVKLSGGCIVGSPNGSANNGGIIYVGSGATVTMVGGNIVGSNAEVGGGVSVAGGSFTLKGGTICGNSASVNGGGVRIGSGTFTMEGGSICYNAATESGGGVYNSAGTFRMIGGKVEKNLAVTNGGGVYCNKYYDTVTTNTFGGTAYVMGNKVSTKAGNVSNNVYVASNHTINVDSKTPLAKGAMLGITMCNTIPAGGKVPLTGTAAKGSEAYFESDVSGVRVIYDTDHLAMERPQYVASVDGTEYKTLQEAVAAAEGISGKEKTVVLIQDVYLTEDVVVSKGMTVKYDLGKFQILSGKSGYQVKQDGLNYLLIADSNDLSFTGTGEFTVSLEKVNDDKSQAPDVNLQYRIDDGEWMTYENAEDKDQKRNKAGNEGVLTVPAGSTIYFRGNNKAFAADGCCYNRFVFTGSVEASGNIMSLIDGEKLPDTVNPFAFYGLFSGCTGLLSAPELPAVNLAPYCYSKMFMGCTSLASVPELKAEKLVDGCYVEMFKGCASLDIKEGREKDYTWLIPVVSEIGAKGQTYQMTSGASVGSPETPGSAKDVSYYKVTSICASVTIDKAGSEQTEYFGTVQEAINACPAGGTVVMLRDTVESVEVTKGQDVILDLGGHELSYHVNDLDKIRGAINNYGTLTVQNGKVSRTGSVAGLLVAVYAHEGILTVDCDVSCTNVAGKGVGTASAYAIKVHENAVLKGGTYTAVSNTQYDTYRIFTDKGSNLIIEGGIYPAPDGNQGMMEFNGDVRIRGGIFAKTPEEKYFEKGYEAIQITQEFIDAGRYESQYKDLYTVRKAQKAAVGKDEYYFLQDAIDAAAEGVSSMDGAKTVTLMTDFTESVTILADGDKKNDGDQPQFVILDLCGHVLNGDGEGRTVTVESGAGLAIIDSKPTSEGHRFILPEKDDDPVWVWDDAKGTEVVNGGIVTGGGIFVAAGATLTMGTDKLPGGSVVGNKAASGAGLYIEGSFSMKDGAVLGNWANGEDSGLGGGIYLSTGGTCELNNVTVRANTAEDNGGGCLVEDTVVTGLTEEKAQLTVSGNTTITDNKAGGEKQNLFLGDGAVITVSNPVEKMKVGISNTTSRTDGCEEDFAIVSSSTDQNYFFCDNSKYKVVFVSAEGANPAKLKLAKRLNTVMVNTVNLTFENENLDKAGIIAILQDIKPYNEISTYTVVLYKTADAGTKSYYAAYTDGKTDWAVNTEPVKLDDVRASIAAGYAVDYYALGEVATLDFMIGLDCYATLAEALAEVENNETITLMKDITNASGITVNTGKTFTIDFNQHTYTVHKPGAGSEGTKTQAFQLMPGQNITFKNGTVNLAEENKDATWVPSDSQKGIAMIIQSYCDLTLDGMTIDGTNIAHNGENTRYMLSTNQGNVTINNTVITAPSGDFAFDVFSTGSYGNTKVEVKGESTVNGNLQMDAGNQSSLTLVLTAGTFNGELKLTDRAKKLISVSKSADVSFTPPAGYYWDNNVLTVIAATVTPAEGDDVNYKSIADAVKAVKNGETMTIPDENGNTLTLSVSKTSPNLKDVYQVTGITGTYTLTGDVLAEIYANTGSNNVVFSTGVNLTLDLKGFAGNFSAKSIVLQSTDSATLTIVDSGTTKVSFPGKICEATETAKISSELFVASGTSGTVTTYYQTLADAFKKAENGATVKLLKTLILTETVILNEAKEISLNLNGKYLSANDARALWVKSGKLTLTGKGIIQSAHTEGNTSFLATGSVIRVGADAAEADDAALVVDEEVRVQTNYCYGITAFGSHTAETVTIYGEVSVKGASPALGGSGNDNTNGAKFILGDSSRKAVVKSEKTCAVYLPQNGSLTVENADITGTTGIELRAGSLTLNKGTVTATGSYTVAANGSGTTTEGAAIAVSQHTTKQAISLTVNGGSLVGGTNGKALAVNNPQGNTETNVTLTLNGGSYTGGFVMGGDYSYAISKASSLSLDAPARFYWKDSTTLTAKTTPDAPVPAEGSHYTVNYTNETISAGTGYQVATLNAESGEYDILSANAAVLPGSTYYVRKAETATENPSGWASFTAKSRPEAPAALTAADVTRTDTSVTVADGKVGMKYILTMESADGTTKIEHTKQINQAGAIVFDGLDTDATSIGNSSFKLGVIILATETDFASAYKNANYVWTLVNWYTDSLKSAPANAPAASTVVTAGENKPTDTSVTVNTVKGNEYIIVKDGGTVDWTGAYKETSDTGIKTFTGLVAASKYTVYTRVAETDTAMPSKSSTTVLYTLPAAPEASVVTVNFTAETVTFGTKYEMSSDKTFADLTKAVVSGGTILPGTTYYVRVKASGDVPAGVNTEMKMKARSAAPTITMANKTETSITLNAVNGCEYSIDGTNWQDSTLFEGLTDGTTYTFYQRFKATSTDFHSEVKTQQITTKYIVTITLNSDEKVNLHSLKVLRVSATVVGMPEGARLEWSATINGIKACVSTDKDGMGCRVTSLIPGTLVIKARLVDANGKEIIIDDHNVVETKTVTVDNFIVSAIKTIKSWFK